MCVCVCVCGERERGEPKLQQSQFLLCMNLYFTAVFSLTCRYCLITDRDACGMAAQELNVEVSKKVAQERNDKKRPPGCWRNSGKKLWYNRKFDSKAVAPAKSILICKPCRTADIECARATTAKTRDANCKGRCGAGVKYRGDGYA